MRKLYFFLLIGLGYNSLAQVTIIKDSVELRTPMYEVNGKLLFAADTAGALADLWVSDGTREGTHVLKRFLDGVAPYMTVGFNAYTPIIFNGAMYFLADSGGGGYALWKSDATEQGTVLVKDFGGSMTGPYNDSYPFFCVLNNELLFAAGDGTHGVELWKTNGTTVGTVLVKDIAADNNSGSAPSFLTKFGNNVYFSCYNETYGVEIWKSDGSDTGTVILKDILPGTDGVTNDGYGGSIDPQFTVSGNYLFFTGRKNAVDGGTYLYRTDGTANGTIILDSVTTKYDPLDYHKPWQVDVNGELMYFGYPAEIGNFNSSIYKSDGTPAGTVNVPTNDSLVLYGSLFSFKGKLYFHGAQDVDATQDGLCVSDGTTSGTRQVIAFPYYSSTPDILDYVSIGNSFFFRGEMLVTTSGTDWRMVQSDGTPNGTIVYRGASALGVPAYYNGDIYFAGLDTITSNIRSLYKLTPGVTLGIETITPGETMVASPNPADETMVIKTFTETNENTTCKVFNLLGENIYTSVLSAAGSGFTVDVSKWENGIYLCTLQQNENIKTLKVVVQH